MEAPSNLRTKRIQSKPSIREVTRLTRAERMVEMENISAEQNLFGSILLEINNNDIRIILAYSAMSDGFQILKIRDE